MSHRKPAAGVFTQVSAAPTTPAQCPQAAGVTKNAPVSSTWAVPTAWLSYLLPAPWPCSKDPFVRVKCLGLLFSLPVHEQSAVILPNRPTLFWERTVLKPLGPIWPGCDLADPTPKKPVPAGTACLGSREWVMAGGTPAVGAGTGRPPPWGYRSLA